MAIKDVFHVDVNRSDLERCPARPERVGPGAVHRLGDLSGNRR